MAHDIESVAAHELGHMLGLHHAANPDATMYFFSAVELTHRRTLTADDTAGVCFLYPATPTPCASDADCPWYHDLAPGTAHVRTRCATTCVPGVAEDGADCFADPDCTSGLCSHSPLNGPAADDPGSCEPSPGVDGGASDGGGDAGGGANADGGRPGDGDGMAAPGDGAVTADGNSGLAGDQASEAAKGAADKGCSCGGSATASPLMAVVVLAYRRRSITVRA